jgi:hypothetical protein
LISGLILELEAGIEADKALEANFVQYRHLSGIAKPIRSEGNLLLWEGHGLIWTTSSPFPSAILITKKGIYQLENNSKTPLFKSGGDNALFEAMAGIFRIKNDQQIKGFAIQQLPSTPTNWQMCLIPQNIRVQNFIQSITVEGNEQITRLSIARPNGDRDEIEINGHAIKDNLPLQLRKYFDE